MFGISEYIYYRYENKSAYFKSGKPYKGWKYVILTSLFCFLLPLIFVGIVVGVIYIIVCLYETIS